MDIGADESNFTFNTMLTLYDVEWSHGTRCATALWGALERADGRELNNSLCIECSTDSYDARKPSHAIRDPRGRPRDPIRSRHRGHMDGSDAKIPGKGKAKGIYSCNWIVELVRLYEV